MFSWIASPKSLRPDEFFDPLFHFDTSSSERQEDCARFQMLLLQTRLALFADSLLLQVLYLFTYTDLVNEKLQHLLVI